MIQSVATYLAEQAEFRHVVYAVIGFSALLILKRWSGGRVNSCERDWAGKMVLVVVSLGELKTVYNRNTHN